MNTTNPDDPAMPRPGANYKNKDGVLEGNTPETGLTAREHAGILLLQPTGTPWLDEMIHARRRDELAKAAITGFTKSPIFNIKTENELICTIKNIVRAAGRASGNGEDKP